MYKAPPLRSRPRSSTRPNESRGFARGFSIQTIARFRSVGLSMFLPLVIGVAPCGSTCAITTIGRQSACSMSCSLNPTIESRWRMSAISTALLLPVSTTPSVTTTKRNMAFSANVIHDIVIASGAQDVLTIRRFAHLIGGCRMGTSPEDSVVSADHQPGPSPISSSPTAASARPRKREPGADHHGAGVAPRSTTRVEKGRSQGRLCRSLDSGLGEQTTDDAI